jgi:ssDNA-specific exonuclease RecJ
LFYPSSRNLSNTLIVSPAPDADLSGFKDIVFLDMPSDFNIPSIVDKNVYVNRDICGYKMLEGLDVQRESLLTIFSALRREVNNLRGQTAEELAFSCNALGFDMREFIFAINVFEELGLLSFADGRLTIYRGIRVELSDSKIYQKVCFLKEN